MNNKLTIFLESLNPIIDKAHVVDKDNTSELLNILDLCEKIHLYNKFDIRNLSEENITKLDIEDIRLKAETLNALFLFHS